MNYFRQNGKNLLIIILIVLNLTIIISFLIQSTSINKRLPGKMPAMQDRAMMGMNRYFVEELELDNIQIKEFVKLRIEFQKEGRKTREKINSERIKFIKELSKDNPDSDKIESIATNIGLYHKDLKLITSSYYLNLKEICNDDQKEKLTKVFLELSKPMEVPPEIQRRMERREFRGRGMHRFEDNEGRSPRNHRNIRNSRNNQ